MPLPFGRCKIPIITKLARIFVSGSSNDKKSTLLLNVANALHLLNVLNGLPVPPDAIVRRVCGRRYRYKS